MNKDKKFNFESSPLIMGGGPLPTFKYPMGSHITFHVVHFIGTPRRAMTRFYQGVIIAHGTYPTNVGTGSRFYEVRVVYPLKCRGVKYVVNDDKIIGRWKK